MRVIIDVEPATIQFLLPLNIPLFLAFGPAKQRAAVLPILQQPLPSMHNLILYWFVTLTLVESNASLQLFNKRRNAYDHFVIGTRTDPRNTDKLSLDTGRKLPQNQNDQFALIPRDGDIVFLGTGLSVFRGVFIVSRCLTITGK